MSPETTSAPIRRLSMSANAATNSSSLLAWMICSASPGARAAACPSATSAAVPGKFGLTSIPIVAGLGTSSRSNSSRFATSACAKIVREGQRYQQQQGQRDGQQGGQSGTASLTTEQRTHIRETVITRGPKVTNVNFSVRVGTVVPRTVHLVEVPSVLIEVYPQYRGREYFVYQDEIIIVDDDMRIVAVLTV